MLLSYIPFIIILPRNPALWFILISINVTWDTEVVGLRSLINADNMQVIGHQNEH